MAPAAATPRLLQLDTLDGLDTQAREAVYEEYVLAVRAARAAGDQARSQELAVRATTLFPAVRRPWLHLAAARLALEQWGPAIEAAGAPSAPPTTPGRRRRCRRDPGGTSLLGGLGPVPQPALRGSAAAPATRHDRDPHWAEAARALGEAEFVAGHASAALAAYTTAFDLDPQAGGGQDLAYFAEARASAGDLAGGIAALQEALHRSPYLPGLHAKLGDLLRREGQLAQAYYELVLEPLVHGVQGPFSARPSSWPTRS